MRDAVLDGVDVSQVFGRVLAGVDDTDAGLAAAVQAARLLAPDGRLELVTAVNLIDGRLQGWPQERVDATLKAEGGPWLDRAASLVGPGASTRLVDAPPLRALLDEAASNAATLIAVGSHGQGRLTELLIGGVSGPLLHEAPCSVLIARSTTAPFPVSIVVGVDGSPSSLEALAVGRYLGTRFGVPLRAVAARHGDVDVVHAELATPDVEIVDGGAVDVLVDAALCGDLLIVGNRGLHGLRALGSVSERVAHGARSSVLVVRPLLEPKEAR